MEYVKALVRKVEKYNTDLITVNDVMMLHLSHDSAVKLRSHTTAYDALITSEKKDPHALFKLMQLSHTVINFSVTEDEQEAAKKRLKDLRQYDAESKRVVPLHHYNQAWNQLHKQAVDLGAADPDPPAKFVKDYLSSLDQTPSQVLKWQR